MTPLYSLKYKIICDIYILHRTKIISSHIMLFPFSFCDIKLYYFYWITLVRIEINSYYYYCCILCFVQKTQKANCLSVGLNWTNCWISNFYPLNYYTCIMCTCLVQFLPYVYKYIFIQTHIYLDAISSVWAKHWYF